MDLRERGEHCHRVFTSLGERIGREWQRYDCEDALLPRIAASALGEEEPHRKVRAADIAAWVITSSQLGSQPNALSDFGQPALTLYRGRRFYIEALQWLDSTTTIHQHMFSGAFGVLEGGSVHTSYRFDEHKRRGDHLLLGDLTWQQSELLEPGDVRPVRSGRSFIHALFHLHHPSISLVVRSDATPNIEVQFNYHPPYLALNPFDDNLWLRKCIGYLKGQLAAFSPDGPALLTAAFEGADARSAVELFQQFAEPTSAAPGTREHEYSTRIREVAIAAARDKFGDDFAAIELVQQESLRTSTITRLREAVRDPGERFFLALLMNVPDRERLLRMIAEAHPGDDPPARVEAWIRALMAEDTHRAGVAIGEDAMLLVPSVIRGEPFEQALARMEAVHGALDEEDHADIRQALDNFRHLDLMRVFTGHRAAPYASLRG